MSLVGGCSINHSVFDTSPQSVSKKVILHLIFFQMYLVKYTYSSILVKQNDVKGSLTFVIRNIGACVIVTKYCCYVDVVFRLYMILRKREILLSLFIAV